MAIRGPLLFCFLALASTVGASNRFAPLNRSSFPAGFVFGAGSAAYQSEGAAFIDGKGSSIWDTFTHQHPDLQPYVTLFHWDLPQALEDEYGGFLSPKIVDDYRDYVDFCFKTFGDRVKHWFTLNEPYTFSLNGYATGTMAPGRCSNYIGNCTSGNSATEPYIVAHHLILSHAAGVKLYREKYKPYQNGQIGVTLVTNWFVPISLSAISQRAARRAIDFMFGWEGADVKGYFIWSFLNDFEWDAGYSVRFGINYIDFKDNLKRYFKNSAFWFMKFLVKN
ncbi:hypothetical protein F0562_014536 [Nyssa sinensis]|uniref:Beta-glucosidase n=1 Tax=Nyssa sinensis TaxID=561372 RepID=A0A5J4ZP51_9ASTE|nr:hypothetical protein F0562_014536 [Nyssa sinensis]